MARNLKRFALALVAAAATYAAAAPAASAVTHHFASDASTTHLTAQALSSQKIYPKTNDSSLYFSCNKVNVTRTIEGTTVEAITVEPTYEECKFFSSSFPSGVTAHASKGCHFRFTGNTTQSITPGEHGTFHIENGQSEKECNFNFTITALKIVCLSIKSQEQTLHGVHYSTVKDEKEVERIVLDMTAHEIHSTAFSNAGCGTKKTETLNDGYYDGEILLSGFSDAAHTTPTDIRVEST